MQFKVQFHLSYLAASLVGLDCVTYSHKGQMQCQMYILIIRLMNTQNENLEHFLNRIHYILRSVEYDLILIRFNQHGNRQLLQYMLADLFTHPINILKLGFQR